MAGIGHSEAMELHDLDLADPKFSSRSAAVADARAAAWCARTPYGLAVLRHREAGLLLRDRRLRQGSHAWPALMGLSGPFARFWTASVIGREGPEHKRLRGILQAALAPEHLTALVPDFEDIAETVLDAVDPGAPVEFMAEFAAPFAGQAISVLLGLPRADWTRISGDAARLGLAMGVDAKRHEDEIDAACLRLHALAEELLDGAGTGGVMARLRTAGAGVSRAELVNLVVMAIFGGVDTTRSQLGLGMTLFADAPVEWRRLRDDPALVPAAVEEMIRARPTTTWATREALETFRFRGVEIVEGATLHILVHASARDPAVAPDPRFDVGARRPMHFGFGGGAHHCLGAHVARTDMAAALRVLTRRIAHPSYAGPPAFLPDSGNTSPTRLPLRFRFA